MSKVVAIKSGNSPETEMVKKAVAEFLADVESSKLTSVMIIAVGHGDSIATNSMISPGDHLRVLALVDMIKTEMALEMLEAIRE